MIKVGHRAGTSLQPGDVITDLDGDPRIDDRLWALVDEHRSR